MSDQELFQENTTPNSDPVTPPNDPFADKLGAIVNEKGEPKYRDVESALEALKHSQEFIQTLQQEKRQVEEQTQTLKAELEKRATVEELAERIAKKEPNQPQTSTTKEKNEGIDEERLTQLMEGFFQSKSQQQQQEENLNQVVQALTQSYGEKAKEVIKAKALELNTTPAELQNLARSNPRMALSLLGGEAPTSSSPAPSTLSSPSSPNKTLELPKLEKSIMQGGAATQDVLDAFRMAKKYANKKLQVEE